MDLEHTDMPTQDLTPDDYEQALHRMKRDLALLQLKRRLRQADLAAAEILEVTREIEKLQAAQPNSWTLKSTEE